VAEDITWNVKNGTIMIVIVFELLGSFFLPHGIFFCLTQFLLAFGPVLFSLDV